MSFWSTSTGESATKDVKQEYDAGGSSEPIPDGSTVLAFIENVGWKNGREEDGAPEFINIQWRIEQPEAVARRVVFQKLWVTDADPKAKDADAAAKKRDKALAMLATIDANSGGKLAQVEGKPSDDKLALALTNKAMVLRLGVWEIGGNSGNWVSAVSPKGSKDLAIKGEMKPSGGGSAQDDLDDDIPF